jgi:hypothetical protein
MVTDAVWIILNLLRVVRAAIAGKAINQNTSRFTHLFMRMLSQGSNIFYIPAPELCVDNPVDDNSLWAESVTLEGSSDNVNEPE